jgi:hypothetical protein
MIFLLVLELAADRIPVAVTCRGTRLQQASLLHMAGEPGLAT